MLATATTAQMSKHFRFAQSDVSGKCATTETIFFASGAMMLSVSLGLGSLA